MKKIFIVYLNDPTLAYVLSGIFYLETMYVIFHQHLDAAVCVAMSRGIDLSALPSVCDQNHLSILKIRRYC